MLHMYSSLKLALANVVFGKRIGSLVAVCVATLAACTAEPPVAVEFKLLFGNSSTLSTGGTRNTSATTMDCYFVNVRGPEIQPRYFPGQLQGLSSPACLGLGAVSNTVSLDTAQNAGVSLKLRPGPQRVVEVYGLFGAPNCGNSDLAPILKSFSPTMHLLGTTTLDITADTSVTIANTYQPAVNTDKFAACRLTPLPQFSFSGVDGPVYAISQVPDGSRSVLIGGDFDQRISGGAVVGESIARLGENGEIDSAFNSGVALGFDGPVWALHPYKDGKTFVGGNFVNGPGGLIQNNFCRLEGTGSVSTMAGKLNLNGPVYAFATPQVGGPALYLGGAFSAYGTVANQVVLVFAETGAREFSFTAGSHLIAAVKTMELSPDGAWLYIGGVGSLGLGRLDATTGAADAAFVTSLSMGAGAVNSIRVAPDNPNHLYIGGSFSMVAGQSRNNIARITSAGLLDFAFNIGTGFNGVVHKIVPVADGTPDIYVAGAFTQYKGQNVSKVVRLKPNGDIQLFFTPPSIDNTVWTLLAPVPRANFFHSLYVGGEFTSYGSSIPAGGILRFSPLGLVK
jgi:hypothetical protein